MLFDSPRISLSLTQKHVSLRLRPGHVPRAYLTQLQRATSEGMPVDGYFLWSAQDNFECIAGYGDRFGLIYVDFDTLERSPSSAPNGSGKPRGRMLWSDRRGAISIAVQGGRSRDRGQRALRGFLGHRCGESQGG
jgi:hypothetical protein